MSMWIHVPGPTSPNYRLKCSEKPFGLLRLQQRSYPCFIGLGETIEMLQLELCGRRVANAVTLLFLHPPANNLEPLFIQPCDDLGKDKYYAMRTDLTVYLEWQFLFVETYLMVHRNNAIEGGQSGQGIPIQSCSQRCRCFEPLELDRIGHGFYILKKCDIFV